MENNTPLVSIGIPVYNGEKYLEHAIDSILAQTFTDFELIISDNASTDRTYEICQSYLDKDHRIRYFRNQENVGAAPNYNRVFELSTGEYFKWADYDDVLAPDFLAKCVAVLDQDPGIVLCFPKARVIDESGAVLGDHQFRADTSSSKPEKRFCNQVLNPDMAYQISGLIRASAIRKTMLHGSFPSSDLVLLGELSLYGQFYEIPEYLFFPRYHPDQSTKGALSVERSRVVFFDTSNAGKILLPKWQLLFGHLRAIRRGPLHRPGKLYCYLQMLRWILKPDHFRALGKDLLLALRVSIQGIGKLTTEPS